MAAWTPEEDELLSELYPTMGNREIASAISERCGSRRTKDAVLGRAQKLGLRKDKAAGYVKTMPRKFWTPEREAWFRSFVPGHTEGEISAEHERLFGTPLSESQIGNGKATFGVKSGTHGGRFQKGLVPANKGKKWDEFCSHEVQERMRRTQFHKGNRPHNQHELLDERMSRDGYWQVKVDPRNAKNTMRMWISRAQFLWMQANGSDWPDRHKALHVDGDRSNDDPENIIPVPDELWPIVMGSVGQKVEFWNRESAEVAITCAKISHAREQARRRARRARGGR